jgi:hypothetical protein
MSLMEGEGGRVVSTMWKEWRKQSGHDVVREEVAIPIAGFTLSELS